VVDPAQGEHLWIQYPRFPDEVKEEVAVPADERRARAETRLAELGDEPGGEEFLARMGVLGDWVVDFAFGDVHTRPGLTARERELIIVAVLASLGSCDPQVVAHMRALRAIDVPWPEIEETILQISPYAGIPRAINAMKLLRSEQENEA
jgi:4-carboxymuconolactone decarboxylase